MKYLLKVATGLATLAALNAALAQDSSEATIDNLIVYGARLEQPVTEVGSSVSIITSSQIEALGVDYVLDAIAAVPGVTINQNGAFGGAASVRIRGASSEQTLVIVDGIVANDPTSPGGGFDFSRLDPANIDRIEVLKGPQSTLWGTDAIGGVINIVTKRPQKGLSGNAFARLGSYNSVRGGAEVSNASDRYDFRLSAVVHQTDGISKADEVNANVEDDGYESTTLNASGGIELTDDVRLSATLIWTDAETEFDSFLFGAQGNVADGDEVSETEQLVANLSLRASVFDNRLDHLLQVGYNDIDRANLTDGVPGFSSKGDRVSFRYQGTLNINDDNRLAFGWEREDNESNGDSANTDGLFALYELNLADAWTLTAGLRQDDHKRFDAETTGRLAVAYNPTEQWTLRASWGEGFKAPTLFQTTFFCCGALAPNLDLRPERSEAFDIGATYRTADARGQLDLTVFDQDTTDLITFSFAVGGYENIAEVRSKGFEVDASYRLTEWLDAGISYANIDAKDGFGDELIRMPRHTADLLLTFSPESRFSGTLLARYNDKESDPNGTVDAWTRIDLAGRYRLSENVELFGRVENLFDEQYQQVIGYGTPGLSGYVGAQLNF